MEKLWNNVVSQVLPEKPTKTLYLCACDSIEELSEKIVPKTKHFGLLLALDARGNEARKIGEAASVLLGKGLAYLCAWGPDCERVHDIFDEEDVGRSLEGFVAGVNNDDTVMTTWHAKESLEEALWFFVHSAFVTPGFEQDCKDWVIAIVEHPDWASEIRTSIHKVVS